MKITIIILLGLLFANSVKAQDLIVTNDGDSIHCKITNIKSDHIYFTFRFKDEIRSTLLPISNVKSHLVNYFPADEVMQNKVLENKNYQHYQFAVTGGFSYQTAKVSSNVPADFKNYVKELKSGYHLGADFTYYIKESLGFGLKYDLFKSSNSMDNIYIEDAYGNRTYGNMSDDLSISFMGPTFSSRFINPKNSNALLMHVSIGYINYSDDKVLISNYKMTGGTVGISFDIGYDIKLSQNLSLGFQLSLLSGSLYQYDLNDGTTTTRVKLEDDEYESLNRIDLSIGLRFNK